MNKDIAAISLDMFENAKKYWLEKLSGELTGPEFSSDLPSWQTDSIDSFKMALAKNLSEKIIHLSNNNDLLLYVLLMTGLKIMLYKYTGQNDIIVSALTLKKSTQSYNRWIMLRDFLHPQMTFKELLMKVKDTVFAGFKNQYYPVHKLMKLLDIPDTDSLSRVTLLLESLHGKELAGLETEGFATDLVFSFEQQDEELEVEVIFNSNFFQAGTIRGMWSCYRHVMTQVFNHTSIKIADVRLIPEEEKKKILFRFNQPQPGSRVDKTIHQLFADQVKKTPGSPAVHFGASRYWTYRELNDRANGLAKVLKQRGVSANCPVGLMIERSAHALLGMLGILKAGGAYIPIDPAYPADRINFMLKDSSTKVLLTREDIHAENEKLETYKHLHGLDILLVDATIDKSEEDLPGERKDTQPGNLFYVIYTSGSTGRPKGVLIPHGNFVNLIHFHKELFHESHGTRMSQVTSLGFDAAAFEIWPCLLNGGVLYIADESIRSDPFAMKQWLIKNEIVISFQSTLMAERLLQENWPQTGAALKVLMTAGDRLKSYPPVDCPFRFYNLYGPTEDTVWTTWTEIETKAQAPARKYPSIGKPVKGKQVFILGVDNRLLPIGAAGELCISGAGLAPGYLNQPELTAEKFDQDFWDYQDYQDENNQKLLRGVQGGGFLEKSPPGRRRQNLYKTGDLARWLPDGNIDFLGRIDHQVKIRGYRIELGEIENQLSAYPGINEAVIMEHTDISGDNYLCAYIVPAAVKSKQETEDEDIDTNELKKYLSGFLPDYMIPSFFIYLEALPLTANGKIDRKNLLSPEFKTAAAYVPPGNKPEEKLAAIWGEILGRDGIGIDDNFFELGGHSLKATNLIAKIHKVFNVRLSLSKFFKAPYIRQIAEYIQHAAGEKYIPPEPVEEKEYYRLSSAHKRLYILQELESDSIAYNMSAMLLVEGEPDRQRFEETFQKLIQRHESFRTSFHMMDNEPVQRIHDEVEFEIEYYDLATEDTESRGGSLCPPLVKEKVEDRGNHGKLPLPEENIIKDFIRPFELSRAPLLRVGLSGHPSQEGRAQKCILMVDMHHIISDGTSTGILLAEFMTLYSGKTLPELPVHYKDYTEWQEKIKSSQFMKQQEEYWLKELEGELVELNLPHDFPRPEIRHFKGQRLEFEIPEHRTDALKQWALQQEITLYVVLLAVVNIFLSKLSGQEDIVIGTAVANRQHADLEHIIGMFVNTLVLKNYPKADLTVSEFLNQIKNSTVKAHENQEYPFDDLVEKIVGKKARDAARNPLFDVVFALQNMELPEVQLPGLKLSPYCFETGISQFDLMLIGFEERKKLKMQFIYSSDLFREQTVKRFIRYFSQLLEKVPVNVNIPLAKIDLLNQKERQQLLFDFNDTFVDISRDKTIVQLWEEQVEKTSDNIAVVGPMQIKYRTYMTYRTYVSYRELNEKSNQLAHLLVEKGVQPDTIVGIKIERSLEMVIGILGILKAGGAYMPIDPDYPQERIDFMLKDSNAKILLTSREITNLSSPEAFNNSPKGTSSFGIWNLEFGISPRQGGQLAYVIYTSGSTGRPKGVLVEHSQVVNTLLCRKNEYKLAPGNTALQLFSYAFDGFVTSFFTPVISGAKVVLLNSGQVADVTAIKDAIIKNHVTHFISVPALYRTILEGLDSEALAPLKVITLAGDTFSPQLLEITRQKNENFELAHEYGVTEAAVMSTLYRHQEKDNRITIGHPVWNTCIYILDRHDCLQPIGMPGELCIAGAGAARGYLNNPELTLEKFITLSSSYNRSYKSYKTYILYRTGDLARWLEDGNIEFLGRIDNQVKIRGYRMELKEIEYHLLRHKEIETVAVIARKAKETGETRIAAYYTKKNKIELWPSLAEYFVYDDLLYHTMTHDEARNEKYRNAIKKVIKDKVVLEIGPGSDAVLARMCVEYGAKKIYAVELLKDAYLKAKETVARLGLEDKIILIHGDITHVHLPEKADYCISEIVGAIGGSEGAAKLINHARQLLKNPVNMIPGRSLTKIAAITLPEDEFFFSFEEVGANYVDKVFEQVGHRFDLRLCLHSFPQKNVISNADVFEDLDFTRENPLEEEHEIYLKINQNSLIHGFMVWLNLYCDNDEVIDVLEKKYIWLPIYFPVFSWGEEVQKNDFIKAVVTRTLAKNQLNPDFAIKGILYKNNGHPIDFQYHSYHAAAVFKANDFYKKIFSGDSLKITKYLTAADLREFLAKQLPQYMIPAYFIELDKIPVNPNGKILRQALPEPGVGESGASYTAPRDALEKKLVEIWSDVLGIKKDMIGIDHNFFQLGGHSLKATVMNSWIYKEFNVKLNLGEIFRNSSIRELAAIISASSGKGETLFPEIPRVQKRNYYPLSCHQQRLYILHYLDPESPAYNLAGYLELLHETDHVLVEKVLAHIIQRHESLRTIFTTVDGHPHQVIVEDIDVPLEVIDLSKLGPEERLQARQQVYRDTAAVPFDLTRPLLFRSTLVKLEPHHYQLMFNMHHIISDGWSIEILRQEFIRLYDAHREGRELELPPLAVQYKDFAQWHNQQIQGPEGKVSRQFWLQKLANGMAGLQLPADWEKSREPTGAGCQQRISKDVFRQLKKLSADHHMTLFTLMFTIYLLFLARICNQKDIACSVIAAGRDHPSLQNIIGFFVNSIIIQACVDEHQPFTEFLQAVNREVIETFQHQSYPLEHVFDHLEIRYPEIPVSFNMVNTMDTALTGALESFEPVQPGEVQDVKFDLEVYVSEYTNGIRMNWVYRKNMFEPATVDYMIQQYINQLEFFVKNPDQSFKEYLAKEKKQKSHRFKKLKKRTNHAGAKI